MLLPRGERRPLLVEVMYRSAIPLNIDGEPSGTLSDFPGEHFLHPLAVMAIGHHLLKEHCVSHGSLGRVPLWEAIRAWCLKVTECQSTADARRKFRCDYALDFRCIDFIWQLLARVHDVGYEGSFLNDVAGMISSGLRAPRQPAEFWKEELKALRRGVNVDAVSKQVLATFGDNAALTGVLRRYCNDLRRRPAHFGWYAHALYGAVILDCFRKHWKAKRRGARCRHFVYDTIVRAVALHHMPSESLKDKDWKWQFDSDPFAFMLRIVDEIPAIRSTIERHPAEENGALVFPSTIRIEPKRFKIRPADADQLGQPLVVECCAREDVNRGECRTCSMHRFRNSNTCTERASIREFQDRARRQIRKDGVFPVEYRPTPMVR